MRALEKPLEARLIETLDFSLKFHWEAGVRNWPVVLTNAHTETNWISVACHAFIFQRAFHILLYKKVQTITFCPLEYTHDASGFQVLKISLSSTVSLFLNRSYMCILSYVSHTEMTGTASLLSTVPFLGTEDTRHAAQVLSEPQLPTQGKARVHLTSTMEPT